MRETKAAFAERTIRSLKGVLYRYMEDFRYQYIHKLPLFLTILNSRKKCSIDLEPKDVKKLFVHYLQQNSTRVQKTKV